MSSQEMHQAQFLILRTLRHAKAVRYTDLRRPTELESDVFKFHLRKLVQQDYVRKLESGAYELTPGGKEFANNLSKARSGPQKQPKLSVAILVSRVHSGRTEYLMQQRLRNPYFGFWGCLSGPVQWGESFESAAERELIKQTGLAAEIRVKAFCRQTDHKRGSGEILEDKLFAVVEATGISDEGINDYQRGHNAWMTLETLTSKDRFFASTCDFIDMLQAGESFRQLSIAYKQEDY